MGIAGGGEDNIRRWGGWRRWGRKKGGGGIREAGGSG